MGKLILGLFLGLLGPFGWIIAYFLHKSFKNSYDLDGAKSLKLGTLITGIGSTVLTLACVAIFFLLVGPQINQARGQGHLTACKANQKNIATALEMWAADHKGKYPKQLSDLIGGENGGYLKQIPTCPAAEKDTYSSSYKRSADGKKFDICCSGHNHEVMDVPADKPAFNSDMGIIEK